MASTYSTNLRLELIGTGEQQGTWGTTTNTNLGTLLEEAIGGYVSVTVSNSGDTTLTTANGAADQARNMTLNLTGTISAARNVIVPAIEKIYVIKNATSGGYAVTVKVSGQTGVSIPNGTTMLVYVDGTDVRQASTAVGTSGALLAGDGSASAPSITNFDDTNTGAFFPAADTFAMSTGGTERVRVDSSGNVGIGRSPSYLLDVGIGSGQFARISTNSGTSANDAGVLLRGQSSATAASRLSGVYIDPNGANASGADYGFLICFGDNTMILGNQAAGPLAFQTSGNEAMRIDSSGNLLVGATAADAGSRLRVVGSGTSSAEYTAVFDASDGSDNLSVRNDGLVFMSKVASTFTTASAANMFIATGGAIYRSTSSLKYKTDVQNATHGLSALMQLRPVTYRGKNDGDTVFGGLIAEEVHEAGLHEFVQYDEDGNPDALAYGNMVSLCIKAIQELSAKVDTLEARIAALEVA